MTEDREGFLALENDTDALEGAERVMAFATVRGIKDRENHIPTTCTREVDFNGHDMLHTWSQVGQLRATHTSYYHHMPERGW